jgi:hypothetical protein
MYLSNFKNFFEDKTKENDPGFLQTGLGVELGMEWSDIVDALESEPWFTANMALGGLNYKLGKWKIVKGTLSPEGCNIVAKDNKRSYIDGRLNKSPEQDENTYHLNRKQLEDFLTQGWGGATPAPS